jgi:hypothetical protein
MATPSFKLPKFDKLPSFQIPSFEMPGIDLTKFDMKKNIETAVDSTKRAVEMATNLSRDVTYVTVGSGVLAFQQVQVRRREFAAAVSSRIPSSVGEVTAAGAAMSARATAFAQSARETVAKIADHASKTASETIVSVRSKVAPSA